jgi:hypothetical protein
MKINAVIHKSRRAVSETEILMNFDFFFKKNLNSLKFPFPKPLHSSKVIGFTKGLKNLYQRLLKFNYLGMKQI